MIIDIVPTLHLHAYSTLASPRLTIRTSNLHSPKQKLLLRSSPPKHVSFAPTTTDPPSTRTAKYCTMDCSNMYLESFLPTPQYVQFLKSLIPPKFYEQYGLDYYADGDYVYARIVRAWYGLKESGKIAHDDIVRRHRSTHGEACLQRNPHPRTIPP
jgi:hypothetical protein